MQVLEHRAGQHLQSPCVELILQLRRIGRQVAVRSELDPLVPRLGDLVQEAVGVDLGRVAREPDAPRIRRGAESDLGHESPFYRNSFWVALCSS